MRRLCSIAFNGVATGTKRFGYGLGFSSVSYEVELETILTMSISLGCLTK